MVFGGDHLSLITVAEPTRGGGKVGSRCANSPVVSPNESLLSSASTKYARSPPPTREDRRQRVRSLFDAVTPEPEPLTLWTVPTYAMPREESTDLSEQLPCVSPSSTKPLPSVMGSSRQSCPSPSYLSTLRSESEISVANIASSITESYGEMHARTRTQSTRRPATPTAGKPWAAAKSHTGAGAECVPVKLWPASPPSAGRSPLAARPRPSTAYGPPLDTTTRTCHMPSAAAPTPPSGRPPPTPPPAPPPPALALELERHSGGRQARSSLSGTSHLLGPYPADYAGRYATRDVGALKPRAPLILPGGGGAGVARGDGCALGCSTAATASTADMAEMATETGMAGAKTSEAARALHQRRRDQAYSRTAAHRAAILGCTHLRERSPAISRTIPCHLPCRAPRCMCRVCVPVCSLVCATPSHLKL